MWYVIWECNYACIWLNVNVCVCVFVSMCAYFSAQNKLYSMKFDCFGILIMQMSNEATSSNQKNVPHQKKRKTSSQCGSKCIFKFFVSCVFWQCFLKKFKYITLPIKFGYSSPMWIIHYDNNNCLFIIKLDDWSSDECFDFRCHKVQNWRKKYEFEFLSNSVIPIPMNDAHFLRNITYKTLSNR